MSADTHAPRRSPVIPVGFPRLRDLLALAKPRVVALIVFTAAIGMFLSAPGAVAAQPFLFGLVGIALASASAAAFNCILERRTDAVMARTRRRPLADGRLSTREALVFAVAAGAAGLAVLYWLVNPLTAGLAAATMLGYAGIYTLILKPLTPQSIVIGGAAGAMPPVLGSTAITGELTTDALILFLIVFLWTPPHFWSLALYRRGDYEAAGMPMLPVTHGARFTVARVLQYTLVLVAASLLPYATGMSGLPYLASALVLGALFIEHAWRLYSRYTDDGARAAFRYSIAYLALLFGALLLDRFL